MGHKCVGLVKLWLLKTISYPADAVPTTPPVHPQTAILGFIIEHDTMRSYYVLAFLPALPMTLAEAFLSPPIGTHEFIPKWEFEPFPDKKVVLNGTIEQVLAELKQINPDYEPFSHALGEPVPSLRTRQEHDSYPRDKIICNRRGWGWVNSNAAEGGVRYLKGVKGQPGAGPGPANCGRVSCGYKAAIWFCNDNAHDITLDSFAAIAEMAGHIHHYCTSKKSSRFNGQAFHPTDNWNVLLRGSSC